MLCQLSYTGTQPESIQKVPGLSAHPYHAASITSAKKESNVAKARQPLWRRHRSTSNRDYAESEIINACRNYCGTDAHYASNRTVNEAVRSDTMTGSRGISIKIEPRPQHRPVESHQVFRLIMRLLHTLWFLLEGYPR